MRLSSIIKWKPENAEAVYKRFEEFGKGNAPDDVKQAFNNINVIVWEKLASNRVVSVIEGEELDLTIWISYWQNLADFEIIETSINLLDPEVLIKYMPPSFIRK